MPHPPIPHLLTEVHNQSHFHTSGRIALEALLLRIMRTHQRLPVEYLVRRLAELEQAIQGHASAQPQTPEPLL